MLIKSRINWTRHNGFAGNTTFCILRSVSLLSSALQNLWGSPSSGRDVKLCVGGRFGNEWSNASPPPIRTSLSGQRHYVCMILTVNSDALSIICNNNNNNNNNYYYYYYYLLQLGCYPVAVVILHVNKT